MPKKQNHDDKKTETLLHTHLSHPRFIISYAAGYLAKPNPMLYVFALATNFHFNTLR